MRRRRPAPRRRRRARRSARWLTTSVSTPCRAAICQPAASGSLLITALICAGRRASQQRLHVAAAARDQDDDALHAVSGDERLRFVAGASADAPDALDGLAGRAAAIAARAAHRLRDTITTMPMPQLNTRSISCSATLPSAAASRTAAGAARRCGRAPPTVCAGKHARHIFQQPAAGDVREAFDVQLAHQSEQRLHVDARGREQRFAERAPMEIGRQVGARSFQNAADQRIAVRVRAARGEPEHGVAGGDARCRR